MIPWGRRLLSTGLVMVLVSAAPALLIALLPAFGEGFFGTLAIMLTITVTPLGVLFFSAGGILLLAGVWKRARFARDSARASSPPAPPER